MHRWVYAKEIIEIEMNGVETEVQTTGEYCID